MSELLTKWFLICETLLYWLQMFEFKGDDQLSTPVLMLEFSRLFYLLFSQKLSVSVSYKVVSYIRDSTVLASNV